MSRIDNTPENLAAEIIAAGGAQAEVAPPVARSFHHWALAARADVSTAAR